MRNCKRMPYAQIIRWRIRVSYALLVLMLAYMVLVAEMGGGDSRRMTDLASAVSRLLFFGGVGVVVSRIVHNKRLLRDRNFGSCVRPACWMRFAEAALYYWA